METIAINAEIRTKEEKNSTIRNSKMVPWVVYGHSQEPILLKLDGSEFLRTYRKAGTSHILNLKVGKKDIEVLVHEIQRNPITEDFTHVDFYAITKGQKLTNHIPINFIGESQAKKEGAIIDEHLKEIEVRCLPRDLVDSFEVDLSVLVDFGDSVKVSDLKVDVEKFELITNIDDVIVSAQKPRAIVEEVETEEWAEGWDEEGVEGWDEEATSEEEK